MTAAWWFVLAGMFLVLSGLAYVIAGDAERAWLSAAYGSKLAKIYRNRARALFWYAFWFFALAVACMIEHLR